MRERSPYSIEIANLQAVLALEVADLRAVAERTLAAEGVAAAEISIALVDNATIHALNREHLQHDEPTDVLSFLLDSGTEPPAPERKAPAEGVPAGPAPPRGTGKRLAGEIVLSAEMARDRAPEFGWSPRDETVLYLVHGLLHLAGYDDLTDEDQAEMRRREREILGLCRLPPGQVQD